MNKPKSFIRSSSGPSYPYPRSHVPMMVVPGTRPLATDDKPKTQKVIPRRRPPLNTAIPTIPESKSNESIMSHASRVSSAADKISPEVTCSPCVVIENRSAVATLHREAPSSTIPRRTGEPMTKRDKSSSRAADASPRSPLMSVAHSVRSKLTKLTRMGRSEPSNSMKGSQSFSGARATKTGIPKRIDQNANRVIKSASMDVPLSTEPSTSKVVIPQNPEPLASEEPSLVEGIKEDIVQSTVQIVKQSPTPTSEVEQLEKESDWKGEEVLVEMKDDVIVVTNETPIIEEEPVETPAQRRSSVEFEETVVRTVVTKRAGLPLSVSFSTKDEVMLQESPLESPGDKENEPSSGEIDTKTPQLPRKHLEEHTTTERHVMSIKTVEENIQIERAEDHENVSEIKNQEPLVERVSRSIEKEEIVRKTSVEKPESTKSPERFILTVKTPEPQRKNQVFVITQTEEKTETKVQSTKTKEPKKSKAEKIKRSKSEEQPRTRFIIRAKTPEGLRRHHTFVIGESTPKVAEEREIVEKRKRVKEKVIRRQKSAPEQDVKSPDRYVMMMKTPEALRRHHTFVIGEGRPKTLGTAVSCREKTKKRLVRQRSSPEEEKKIERFVMMAKTPVFLRRYHTFMVGDRVPSPDVPFIEEGELTEPIATVGPMAGKKRTRSEEPRRTEEKPREKYILTTRTPMSMRKFQTFVVENKKEPILATSSSAHADMKSAKETVVGQSDQTENIAAVIEENSKKFMQLQHKSLDETRPMSPEKYILTASTPLAMRKFNTFSVEEKTPEIRSISPLFPPPPQDEMESEVEEVYKPIKPSEMYVLTATTPLPQRKHKVQESKESQRKESKLEQIARDKRRDTSKSPDRGLFVMGRRNVQNSNVFVISEKPKQTLVLAPPTSEPLLQKQDLRLEVKEMSPNSDKAERRMSCQSGEMTSPEEEIPMDTQPTPTDDEAETAIVIQSIRMEDTEPIQETIRESPVFCPPSPPKEKFSPIFSSKSTSPIKSSQEKNAPVMSSPLMKMKSILSSPVKRDKKQEKLEKERSLKEKKDERDAEKPPKTPLSARSLRSAGRMLAPSFFRKEHKTKMAKVPPVSKSMSFGARTNMDLSMRNRRAPLAEFESTRVANSPMVENNPISFDKWNSSPRNKRRHSEKSKVLSDIITEESDGNGNPQVIGIEKVVASPVMGRHDQDRGLIDDEILDQPMLMGDSFSHSESLDGISLVRRAEFEAEKATIISIDRSMADEIDTPRRQENANKTSQAPPPSCVATIYSSNGYEREVQDGLNEVQDIRSQLEKLQELVNQEQLREANEEHDALVMENDALRRQLLEKDQVINALKQQLTSLKTEA